MQWTKNTRQYFKRNLHEHLQTIKKNFAASWPRKKYSKLSNKVTSNQDTVWMEEVHKSDSTSLSLFS